MGSEDKENIVNVITEEKRMRIRSATDLFSITVDIATSPDND
jgi:hypothetical protein